MQSQQSQLIQEPEEILIGDDSPSSHERSISPIESADPRISWIGSHYSVVMVENSRKRRCLSANCNQHYSLSVSQNTLRKHWDKKHRNSTHIGALIFSRNVQTDRLVRLIVDCFLEYSLVERPSFREFVKTLIGDEGLIINRHALSSTILEGMDKVRRTLITRLVRIPCIALTTDFWSDRHKTRGYGCITGHFINDEAALESFVLDFKHIPHPHDAELVCKFLCDAINSFDLKKKIISITSDNGQNMVKGIDMCRLALDLDLNFPYNFFQFRCVAHVLHLCVTEAVKALSPALNEVRQYIENIKCSTKRMEKFEQIQLELIQEGDLDIPRPLKLIGDVKNRWSSSLKMLNRFITLRTAVEKAIEDEPEAQQFDWPLLSKLNTYFMPFAEVTNWLEGSNYVTVSLVRVTLPRLLEHMNKDFGDESLNRAALSSRRKLEDYNTHMNSTLLYIATLLDPRLKLIGLDHEVVRFVKLRLSSFIGDEPEPRAVDNNSTFADLFASESGDEINRYISLPRIIFSSCPIKYWHSMAETYPKLSKIALQLLCIQATSSASERTFSKARDIDSDKRNRLSPESFRANILLNSWIKFLRI